MTPSDELRGLSSFVLGAVALCVVRLNDSLSFQVVAAAHVAVVAFVAWRGRAVAAITLAAIAVGTWLLAMADTGVTLAAETWVHAIGAFCGLALVGAVTGGIESATRPQSRMSMQTTKAEHQLSLPTDAQLSSSALLLDDRGGWQPDARGLSYARDALDAVRAAARARGSVGR